MAGADIDVLAMGRSSIDLYANEIGQPFHLIKSFGAFVGGSPTNVAVGVRRLGLRSALLSAVGDDPVGEFIRHFLRTEGVQDEYTPTKSGHRTSAVLLGIQPPDRFPLVFYRDNCADREIDVHDVARVPWARCRVLFVTGTGFSTEPSRSATASAMRSARAAGAKVVLDIDLRLDQWTDAQAFAHHVGAAAEAADFVIGTEEEFRAAAGVGRAAVEGDQQSSPVVEGTTEAALARLSERGAAVFVVKQGARGVAVRSPSGATEQVAPFEVDVVNVLGAGDAFAAGFIFGLLSGKTLREAAQLGNGCGAILVTKQGCANFMPTRPELFSFIERQGVSSLV